MHDTMTARDWLAKHEELRQRIGEAERTEIEAAGAAKTAADCLDDALAAADEADADPHRSARAKGAIDTARKSDAEAKARHEEAAGQLRGLRRNLADHETTGPDVLAGEVQRFRDEARGALADLGEQWAKAAEAFAVVAARVHALHATAGGSITVRNADDRFSPTQHTLLGDMLRWSLDAATIPKLGSSGTPGDRLVDHYRSARDADPNAFAELSERRADLQALASALERLARQQKAA